MRDVTTHTDFDGADIVRACIRKRGYATEKFARLALAGIRRVSPDADVRVYACRQCGLWHVGGSPGAGTRDASARRRHERRDLGRTNYRGRERRHENLSDRAPEITVRSHGRRPIGGLDRLSGDGEDEDIPCRTGRRNPPRATPGDD
jgi:hypothetical protein